MSISPKINRNLLSGLFLGLGIGFLASYLALGGVKNDKGIYITGNIIPLSSIQEGASNLDGKPLGSYLASRSGTKYYPTGCKSANRIKEENRIWFTNKESAENAGYEPASNC